MPETGGFHGNMATQKDARFTNTAEKSHLIEEDLKKARVSVLLGWDLKTSKTLFKNAVVATSAADMVKSIQTDKFGGRKEI